MSWDIIDWQQFQWIGLLALSSILGALIGAERELADKPAGLRTHIIVCIAATLLMFLGNAVVDMFQESEATETLKVDPIRVIQAIVIGISFLGAGTIIHQEGEGVEGLTTAASILLTAGIGIAVGSEQYVMAIGTTILALVVLLIVGRAETALGRLRDKWSNRGKSNEKTSQNDESSASKVNEPPGEAVH